MKLYIYIIQAMKKRFHKGSDVIQPQAKDSFRYDNWAEITFTTIKHDFKHTPSTSLYE